MTSAIASHLLLSPSDCLPPHLFRLLLLHRPLLAGLVFGRFKPKPPTPWHVPTLALLTLPIHYFFLSQAALIFLEGQLLGSSRKPSSSALERAARRALLWVGLLTCGRHVTAYLYQLGCFHPSEFFNWSESVRLLGEMRDEIRG